MGEEADKERAWRRQERNRRHYQRCKGGQERVLLRLEPGGRAALDAAARAIGLSRSAAARLLLPAIMTALTPRLLAVEAARSRSGQSLGRFLALALDEALARSELDEAAPAPEAAAEFDALFGGGA